MDEHQPEQHDEVPSEQEPLEEKVEATGQPQAAQDNSTRDTSAAERPGEVQSEVSAEEPAEPVEPMASAEIEAATAAAGAAELEPIASDAAEEQPAMVEAESEAEPQAVEPRRSSALPTGRRSGQLAQGEMPPEASSEPAWYVIHCYSGYENKVRHNLEQRIETMGMKDRIFDVVIPTQEEIEVREGKRRTVERHIFPGYVLVNMTLSEKSWYVVRNTPGVTGFVGMGNLPTALRPEEVSQIVKRMEAEAPTVKVSFKEGERVRIIDGPFNDFRGTVAEIDMERTKVRVMVSFFGRETPVELDFLQVEKA